MTKQWINIGIQKQCHIIVRPCIDDSMVVSIEVVLQQLCLYIFLPSFFYAHIFSVTNRIPLAGVIKLETPFQIS